jgi:pimeloyl-ACP methyl ester carboxylesterase
MPFVDNGGIRIHYEVDGQNSAPSLLLQHGFADSIESWRQHGYVDALKEDYYLILVDARGHGLSDKPHDEESYQFVHMVADLVAVLDALKIDKCHYWGYSMGADAGFYTPIYTPGRFCSLILGGWAFAREGRESADHRAMFAVHRAIGQAIAENPAHPMEAFVANIEQRTGPLAAVSKSHYLSLDALALATIAEAHGHPAGPGAEEILPLIRTPCLLYAGEKDPVLEAARECAGKIAGSTFVSFPGMNHLQCFEHSEIVLPFVKKFMEEAERG